MNLTLDLDDKATEDLVAIFQDESQSRSIRDGAFIVLCLRFRKNLLEKCEFICERFNHNALVAELIAERTFKKYATNPGYLSEKSKAPDCNTGFLLYLCGIAEKELTNYYREQKRRMAGYDYDGTEQVIADLPDIPQERLDVETKVKHAAIQSLSQNQKAVYLTYQYYEREGFNLPRKLQADLRAHIGVEKQARIRGIKKEAVDIVNAYVEAMTITKKEINGAG
ncbi:MAG: hypothetical protein R2813_08730 [Flavobacteriales bacterium]